MSAPAFGLTVWQAPLASTARRPTLELPRLGCALPLRLLIERIDAHLRPNSLICAAARITRSYYRFGSKVLRFNEPVRFSIAAGDAADFGGAGRPVTRSGPAPSHRCGFGQRPGGGREVRGGERTAPVTSTCRTVRGGRLTASAPSARRGGSGERPATPPHRRPRPRPAGPVRGVCLSSLPSKPRVRANLNDRSSWSVARQKVGFSSAVV